MNAWRWLVVGFAFGGVITLFLHGGSRRLMTYCLQRDNVGSAIAANPIVTEPLELFPPRRAAPLSSQERLLIAYRITRRLNQDNVHAAPSDMGVAVSFARQCSEADEENGYWPQLEAALLMKQVGRSAALAPLHSAAMKKAWLSGDAMRVRSTWNELENCEAMRLAWQGFWARKAIADEPAAFISMGCADLASGNLEERYLALANAALMLNNATTFAVGNRATELANQSISGTLRTVTLSHPELEKRRAALAGLIGTDLGSEAGSQAEASMRAIQSWEQFVKPSQIERARALQRVRIEALVTAALPSALLVATLALLIAGLFGRLLATWFDGAVQFDSRLAIGSALVISVVVAIWSGYLLAALWVLAIGALLALPTGLARKGLPEFGQPQRVTLRLLGALAFGLAVISLVLGCTASKYLGFSASAYASYPLGAYALAALSMCIPIGAVCGRRLERNVLSCVGDALRVAGMFAAGLGVVATIVVTPLCIYSDSENRKYMEKWIGNEPELFRVEGE